MADLKSYIPTDEQGLFESGVVEGYLDYLATKKSLQDSLLPTTTVHNQKTVTTAGTRVVLGSSTTLKQGVWIKAFIANTGVIYVGSSTVTSSNGYRLNAGENVFVANSDLANIYIDAAVSGEGVSFIGG